MTTSPLPLVGGPDDPAPRPISRRRFVRVAALGAVAVGGVAAVGARVYGGQLAWWQRRIENYAAAYSWAFLPPAARLRRHFDYLTLAPGTIERFVREYERACGRVTVRDVAANRRFHTAFLMSTDFFRTGADPRRPARFVALHDPYRSPCWVPFPPA